jgi:hypothetical protein
MDERGETVTKEQDTAMFDQPDPEVLFERWIVSAEHLAGHELDLVAAEIAWYAGLTPGQYVTSLVPKCAMCDVVNANGGPPHDNQSPSCRRRNGARTHCTCGACW